MDELGIAAADPNIVMTIPFTMLLGYGAARASMSLMHEMRGVVFAKVQQVAIRELTLQTFEKLHAMDMAFHLNRSTGALAKAIDRGTRGVNFIINQLTFTLFPTALEIGLVFTLLGVKFGPQFVGVSAATLAAYVGYTVAITRWRTQFRRDLNLIENKCSAHVFDSLINYDTVKYFNNEKVPPKMSI